MVQLLECQILPAPEPLRRCRRIETRRHPQALPDIPPHRRAGTRREPSTMRLTPQCSTRARAQRACLTLQPLIGVRLGRRAPLVPHRSAKVPLTEGACPTSRPRIGVALAHRAPLVQHRSAKVRLTRGACPTRQPRIEVRLAGRAPLSDRAKPVRPTAPVNSSKQVAEKGCLSC